MVRLRAGRGRRPGPRVASEPRVGVDLGITTLATLSAGETIPGLRAGRALLGRLRRTSRGLSRETKGSADRAKAKRRLARLHARIAAVRRDATHRATAALVRRFARIGVEDLDVRGIGRNHSLARSIVDGGLGESRRQLDHEARRTGALVVVADRSYPSSETCSCCGAVEAELALSERTFRCDACGHALDRGVDAARNLEDLAASFAVTACGGGRSGPDHEGRVKRPSVKQGLDGEAA